MTERGLIVDHTTFWCRLQCYAPELDRRVGPELKRTGASSPVDETYVRVAGTLSVSVPSRRRPWRHARLLFLEGPGRRGYQAFFCKFLVATNHPRARVINKVGKKLKQERILGRHCPCRTCPYLINIVEQDAPSNNASTPSKGSARGQAAFCV